MTRDRRDSDLRELVVGPRRILRPGLDFHRVIANTQFLRQKILQEEYEILIEDPYLIQRDIAVKRLGLVPDDIFTDMMKKLYANPDAYMTNVYPYPGALETIFYHFNNGDETFIITASGEEAFQCCIQWCEHHYLDSSILKIYGSGKDGSKVELARQHRLTSQLDDGLVNLLQIRNAPDVSTRPILMFRPREQAVRQESWPGITVVFTFQHYQNIMEKMRVEKPRASR